MAEYRVGNAKENYVRKIPGVTKAGDVTLKRGVIGAQNISAWIKEVRNGNFDAAKRDVVIQLLDEKRGSTPCGYLET